MKPLLLIFAWRRPRHLYVTLKNVLRLRGLERYDLLVFFDGDCDPMGPKICRDLDVPYETRPHRLGNRQHIVKGLEDSFQETRETVYIEEDMLLRADALDYLETVTKLSYMFCCLQQWNTWHPAMLPQFIRKARQAWDSLKREVNWYIPRGNRLRREDFLALSAYLAHKDYLGKEVPGHPGAQMTDELWNHDAFFTRYMLDTGRMTLLPPKDYLLHFGTNGTSACGSKAIEREMFSGDPNTWTDNVLRVYQEHPEAFEKIGFEYL